MHSDTRSDLINVVVVDDNQRARKSLAALLNTYPHIQVVGIAADGAEAVALTREFKPDVVVMDVMMPVMDGIEAARLIKLEPFPVGVILLTLYGGMERDARNAGADVFMLKVDSGSEIVAAIERNVPGGWPRASSP